MEVYSCLNIGTGTGNELFGPFPSIGATFLACPTVYLNPALLFILVTVNLLTFQFISQTSAAFPNTGCNSHSLSDRTTSPASPLTSQSILSLDIDLSEDLFRVSELEGFLRYF